MIKHVFLLLVLIKLTGCKPASEEPTLFEKLQGRWQIVEDEYFGFHTLDISDSTVLLNRWDRSGFFRKGVVTSKNDSLYLPFWGDPDNMVVERISDTLYLRHLDILNGEVSSWVRVGNSLDAIRGEVSQFSMVEVNLSENENSIPFDWNSMNKPWVIMSLGIPQDKSHGDSVKTQVNDVFLESKEIVAWLKLERDKYPYSTKEIMLVLNADSLINNEQLIRLVEPEIRELPFIKEVYRTCLNNEANSLAIHKILELAP